MKHLKLSLKIKRVFIVSLVLFTGVIFCKAQVPQGINYQTVVRNNDGSPIVNQQLSFRISILSGSPIGDVAYSEVHFVNSDQLGVVNFAIGTGSPVAGTFDGIGWGQTSHFLQVELDAQGGSTFVPMGTTPFFSVPYALFAESSGSSGAQVLNELEDVNTALAIGGQVLGFDEVSGQWIPLEIETGGIESLTELADVSALTPSDGQILRFNQALGLWVADFESVSSGVENLEDLADVTSAAAQNGQVLKYNGSLEIWQPAEDLIGQGDNWGQQVVITNSTLAGSGITGSALGLAQQGATNGQVLKWNGTTWAPSIDLNSIQTLTLTGNTLSISSGNNVTLPTPTFSGWNITGNSGTNAANNFIGTTDDQPFLVRTNNVEHFRLTTSGHIECLNTGNSVFLGENAGSLDNGNNRRNTYVGANSGQYNITGIWNTAMGYNSLRDNNGISNTAIGASALQSATASFNVGVGSDCLRATTTGWSNTGVGTLSLVSNTTGSDNVGIGETAIVANQTGQGNVGVGKSCLADNVSGSFNTAVGFGAGDFTSSGSYNTCIGNGTVLSNTMNTHDNKVTLAGTVGIPASGANTVRIGNASTVSIGGAQSWSTFSDQRIKKNVAEDVIGLDFILQLRPVTYGINLDECIRINSPSLNDYTWPDKYEIETKRYSGFLAQEVFETAQLLGYNFSGVDVAKTDSDLFALRYAEFVVPLVKAVQEQQEMIDALNDEISALRLTLQNLADEVQALNRQQTR